MKPVSAPDQTISFLHRFRRPGGELAGLAHWENRRVPQRCQPSAVRIELEPVDPLVTAWEREAWEWIPISVRD
jgi:hypothetical protein